MQILKKNIEQKHLGNIEMHILLFFIWDSNMMFFCSGDSLFDVIIITN